MEKKKDKLIILDKNLKQKKIVFFYERKKNSI